MRIGLDIDDTICNTNFILMKYAYKYNEENTKNQLIKYNTNNFSEVFGWDYDETNRFFDIYYLDALKEIQPKFNVKEVLTKLKSEGNEIIFITVRNDKECKGENEASRITKQWLEKYEIPYDELHTNIKDKKEFCKNNNIDVFIDDSEKHCLSVSELGIKTYMMMNDFNLDFKNEKITNVYSISEFYELIHLLEGEI